MGNKHPKLPAALLGISAALQAAALAAVWVLQDLTGKKAGVNHHLRFQKTAWLRRYQTDANLLIVTVILVILAAAVLVLLYRRKSLSRPAKASALLTVFWCAAGILSLYLPQIEALLVYPYLLLAEGLALLFSLLPLMAEVFHRNPQPERSESA